jgi:CRISPR-associated protein Cmr3
MIKFTLTPYDVLFFGSGRPFNRGDVVASVFPPHPNTFASAICSKIYHLKNIDVSNILKTVYGPFIKKDEKVYFPKPQNIYKERKKKEIEKVFVVNPLDKGLKLFNPENTNKPQIQTFSVYKGIEEVEPFNAFISFNGLKNWLNNQKIEKDDILQYKDIFENEPRIGIKIEPSLYSVGGGEDALYRIDFLRLKEDVKFVFWVEFDFSNGELKKANLDNEDKIFEFFNDEPRVLKLGGEMKNVSYEIEKSDFKEWIRNELKIENIQLNKGDKIEILFLTYGVFDFEGDKLPKISNFQIHSACFGNYEIVGINSKNLGRKIKRAFPPGTVMWLKFESESQRIIDNNPTFIVKKKDLYEIDEPRGKQEFIGTNLILIKKEVKNV